MKNTNFSNPHGLDNTNNHYSTAYDMALLTRYAMQNKTYAKIAGTKVHRAPNSTEQLGLCMEEQKSTTHTII